MAISEVTFALSGGVGGAKLALGLQLALPRGALTVLVNTGDDMRHLGLDVCPDVDTTLYTLAGVANPELGWGRAEESWNFLAEFERLGGESWFRLGDKDLALHVERTVRLAAGETLESVTAALAERFGLSTRVVPMSNDVVRTIVETEEGTLPFQEYFVRRRCAPVVRRIRFEGAAQAEPAPSALKLLASDRLSAVVICPSNPYLSLDPMLAIAGLRRALARCGAPIVAVSPIIGGESVKGPTAKIMRELGIEVSATAIARHYAGLIDGFVLDDCDQALADRCSVPTHVVPTRMASPQSKQELAQQVLSFAQTLRPCAARAVS